jgi:NurA-like 5'-3' nuclease
MNVTGTWIIKSRHINPNAFYVRVDGSDFYTAYWVANTQHDEQARSMALEASEELVLGQVEILEGIIYSGQLISNEPEVDAAINAAVGKYTTLNEVHLAAWISSQGGLW